MKSSILPSRPLLGLAVGLPTWALLLRSAAATCGESYDTTFELIQDQVFERSGCTEAVCHGAEAQGGLNLTPSVAYENLVDVEASTVEGIARVLPGQKERSLLWLNLAAASQPAVWKAPLRPMPLPPVAPLSDDALEVVRLWIEAGAPAAGVVAGTGGLLDACLPPAEPLTIPPLPPPAQGEGVQLRMPARVLAAQSEAEVCFMTYYDVSDHVPAAALNQDGTRFRYRLNRVRQSPFSHHLFMTVYAGPRGPDDPVWGEFRCLGGALDGELCDTEDPNACGDGACATQPRPSFGCEPPGSIGAGLDPTALSFTQETSSDVALPDGVYGELPVKGVLLWNSHGINPTGADGTMEAWLNFWFAPAEGLRSRLQPFFNDDVRLAVNTPPFATEELCHINTFPRGAHLFEISSHAHKRMKRWRTYLGAWRCDGGLNDGRACSPLGYDFASADVCAGAPCVSRTRPRVADCDFSGDVTVDEIITTVNIALGINPVAACDQADGDLDRQVTVDEIVGATRAALVGVPQTLDASRSLFYVSLLYSDPIMLRFEPALPFASEVADERAVTYCALYDNGFTDPTSVKRRSTSPLPPDPERDPGGPCDLATHCTAGRVGAECDGLGEAERAASCDSQPDAGDGVCDACPLLGGATTDDEMCILWGEYYVSLP